MAIEMNVNVYVNVDVCFELILRCGCAALHGASLRYVALFRLAL
jgi:hypothetical protein